MGKKKPPRPTLPREQIERALRAAGVRSPEAWAVFVGFRKSPLNSERLVTVSIETPSGARRELSARGRAKNALRRRALELIEEGARALLSA